jgi:class 3 adenylate cyclase
VLEKQRELDAIARERERERAVLYSTLPRAIADRVIRGETVNDAYEAAAVLFADVAGFTEQSSRFSSDEVVRVLATLHAAIDDRCAEHGVVKVKTIGDAYMAFAADGGADENCRRTAHLAADMVALTVSWPDGTPLSLRIGLHVGPVSAGVIGTDRLQYDVWGDTVNMASRLESSGEPTRIHVCDERFRSEGFVIAERGEMELKGKGRVRTYWLMRSPARTQH